jgi:hypothetical protein
MARWEAGLHKRRINSRVIFSDDTEMRIVKQLLAAKKLNWKKVK